MSRRSFFEGSLSSVDCTCDLLDKKKSIYKYVKQMLNKTSQIFEYKGLPDSIPQYMLELYLQINGQVCITKVKDTLYALPGGLGGAPDPYYRPTLYVTANPGLGYSASLKILNHMPPFGKQASQGECVLVRNDTLMEGLFYTFTRFATELTENDVSIRSAQINARAQTQISASTDSEIASAQKYLDDLVAGKLSVIAEKSFLDGVKVNGVSMPAANIIIQLIELQQYLKASWYNEIGLNANYNMKREYLSEEELAANTDALLPLVDDMLECRKTAFDFVNKTYGTNITVEKSSAWFNKQDEVSLVHEEKRASVEAIKDGGSVD